MRLRSGKDVYDRVLESFKGEWPTRRQSRSLAIQTDDLNTFLKHCQWLIEKIVNHNRDAARLTTFAISESLFACHGLQPKVWVRSFPTGKPGKASLTVSSQVLARDTRNKLREVRDPPELVKEYIRDLHKIVLKNVNVDSSGDHDAVL